MTHTYTHIHIHTYTHTVGDNEQSEETGMKSRPDTSMTHTYTHIHIHTYVQWEITSSPKRQA